MSAETWVAEFYPVPASQVAAEDALDHSIRKWEGLQPGALAKHGVFISVGDDEFPSVSDESATLKIDAKSCALCETAAYCDECQVWDATDDDCDWQFRVFKAAPHDPVPMLNLLKRVKAAQEAKRDPETAGTRAFAAAVGMVTK